MTFVDRSFDAVFSRAVFEHLSDPQPVLAEVRRVLKPGGAMFVSLHLYSSDSGCHDTRIFLGNREDLPLWSHLRPQYQSLVHPNSYLNKLNLTDWQQLFQSEMPGSQVFASCDAGGEARKALHNLRAKGELKNYSDEELLTVTLEISWRKPTE
jgi:SAM-dependent methyltransferase